MAPARGARARRWGPLVTAATLQILAPASAKDPCACLNWKEVYQTDTAMCGEGLEYHIAHWGTGMKRREIVSIFAWAGNDAMVCKDFFKKLDSDLCVNVGPYERGKTDWTGMTWCYVSKECDDLYGGKRLEENANTRMDWLVSFVNDPRLAKVSQASWKFCRPGKDPQLRDLAPLELMELCEKQGLSMRSCTKYAYPGSWTHFFWPQMDWAWYGRADPNTYPHIPDLLKDAMAKEEPMIIDTQGGGWFSDLVLVHSNAAWYLHYNTKDCPDTQYCRYAMGEAPGSPEFGWAQTENGSWVPASAPQVPPGADEFAPAEAEAAPAPPQPARTDL